MTIDNLAVPGAGNTHIKNSVILHLEKTKPDRDTTLIIIMWSGPERIDWITDRDRSQFKNVYPFEYRYDKNNELVLGGNWWANTSRDHVNSTVREYSKYQNNSSLALSTWLQIQDLNNYLTVNEYNYYFTSWFDYQDPVDSRNRWIDLDSELNQIGLGIDRSQWLAQGIDRSLGRWGQNHPEFLTEDNLHIGWSGHEAWLQEILIPELTEKNVLYDNTAR